MSRKIETGQSPFGWHRIQTFMQCPTKYYHSYIAKTPRGKLVPDLKFGILMHVALAHYYARKQKDAENDIDGMCKIQSPSIALFKKAEDKPDWKESYEAVRDIFAKYRESRQIKFWEKEFKIISIEEIHEYKINNKLITFRADLVICSKKTGLYFIVDHKTTPNFYKPNREFDIDIAGYVSSGQVLGYQHFGRKEWGEKFGGVILNFISQHQIFDSCQIIVPESEGHLDSFPSSVEVYLEWIKRLEDRNAPMSAYPRVQSEFTCVHKYGKCEFYDYCFQFKN